MEKKEVSLGKTEAKERAQKLRSSGMSLVDVAKTLTAEGYKTARGLRITDQTVYTWSKDWGSKKTKKAKSSAATKSSSGESAESIMNAVGAIAAFQIPAIKKLNLIREFVR